MMLRPKLHAVVKCLDAELTYVGWQTSWTIKHDYCSSYNPSQMSCHDDLGQLQTGIWNATKDWQILLNQGCWCAANLSIVVLPSWQY